MIGFDNIVLNFLGLRISVINSWAQLSLSNPSRLHIFVQILSLVHGQRNKFVLLRIISSK